MESTSEQLEEAIKRAREIMSAYGSKNYIKESFGDQITSDSVRLASIKAYFSELVAEARRDYLLADEMSDYQEKDLYVKYRKMVLNGKNPASEDSKAKARIATSELRLNAVELRYKYDRLSMLRDDLADLTSALQSRNKHLVSESVTDKIKG